MDAYTVAALVMVVSGAMTLVGHAIGYGRGLNARNRRRATIQVPEDCTRHTHTIFGRCENGLTLNDYIDNYLTK